MPWNWEFPKWPHLHYDSVKIAQQEYGQFIVEILSIEGAESSKIEGEILDRESLQSIN